MDKRENNIEEIMAIIQDLDADRIARVLKYCELHYLESRGL